MVTAPPIRRSRLDIAVRTSAAVIGSYALAAALAFALARVLPMARSEATIAATLLSFVALPVGAIWAFTAARARSAWGGLLLPIGLLLLAGWAIGPPR